MVGALQLSVVQFQEDNAWPNASLFFSHLMMCWFILNPLDHTSSMMMISTGTLVLLLPQPKNLKKLKRLFYKFIMKKAKQITFISHGYAGAIS